MLLLVMSQGTGTLKTPILRFNIFFIKCLPLHYFSYPGQVLHHSVVFSEEDGVHGRQGGLLTRSDVSGHETLPGLSLALLVGLRGGHHHLTTTMSRSCGVETTPLELSQTVRLADILTIDLTRVNKCSVLIQLLSWSQSLLS